jgi:hypothetical protein
MSTINLTRIVEMRSCKVAGLPRQPLWLAYPGLVVRKNGSRQRMAESLCAEDIGGEEVHFGLWVFPRIGLKAGLMSAAI